MRDDYGESYDEPPKETAKAAHPPSVKFLYGVIAVLLMIIALLLIELYDGFDFFDLQYHISSAIRSYEQWYHRGEQDSRPSIQRANFYAYGGLTIDVRNVPDGGAEPLVNGKDISGTLENIGSFVADDDGMTYERYDFVGSMKDLNVTTGINEVIIRYADVTLPKYKLYITVDEAKVYEKTFHRKLSIERRERRWRRNHQ